MKSPPRPPLCHDGAGGMGSRARDDSDAEDDAEAEEEDSD
jgi:hypothetical protein